MKYGLLATSLVLFVIPWPTAWAQTQSAQPSRTAPAAGSRSSQPFDPHDLSGVWFLHGSAAFTLSNDPPPMTPWAKARYDANKPGIGPRQQPLGNDPMMVCDPVGYPRVLFYNAYPVEFVQTHDRIVQFFDYFYTHRTIWTDGRELPKDPDPSWYGWAVGKWEGDTLMVDSIGFNDRSWLDADGHPHSDEMKLQERYRRVDHDTIEATLTLIDSKAYTKPWVSETKTLKLDPKMQIREDVCVPSDEAKYKEEMRQPAATPSNSHP